ncbi:eukaryotic translation initiation factor 4E-binding protein Mextli isoform X1 [Chironomus tepperi]|uniref:eukaryotic translation initiation factor 4E-binding protein Mextli isoform X1 n=1 Tax=Chironomus tepperi TaxID=113505 RepID=UPI00391F41B9
MSQIGRALEAPRPLKSTIKQQSLPIYQQNIEITSIEDLIAITEAVAMSLNQGDVSIELFNKMFQSLVMHGQQLEIYSKEILDRCFNVFRNASQDDRLKISIRLNLLNLIELRANSWVGNKCADYYKSKAQSESDIELTLLSSSPSIGANAAFGQSLGPGEVVKNSGKFTKPTKIPGKNYSKDEIIIRNCDSGKVMGIKGRRVHIIEEMSNCVISFQRVNAGAKERLVQITGPHEDNINYAKNLIEDTIKRNASPIRDTQQEGSMSSLASSDDQQMSGMRSRGGVQMSQNPNVPQLPMTNKLSRSNSHHNAANYLTHSASANDASLGEYKYTVNVGIHSLKITGDSLDLVKVAKLVLDDFFTNDEFLKSHEAILMNSDMGIVPAAHQLPSQPSPFIDSGVHLDLLSRSASGLNVVAQQITNDLDDEVFMHPDSPPVNNNENVLTSSSSIESSSSSNTVVSEQTSSILPSSGLARSRRSHFSRKDSTPETTKTTAKGDVDQRITYSVKSLWWFCKNSSLCKCTPSNMDKIRKECPFIVREKQGDSNSNIVHYYDVDKYMELREKMDKRYTELKNDDIIEIDDED